jgi:Cu-Zn family superoxide dismutase
MTAICVLGLAGFVSACEKKERHPNHPEVPGAMETGNTAKEAQAINREAQPAQDPQTQGLVAQGKAAQPDHGHDEGHPAGGAEALHSARAEVGPTKGNKATGVIELTRDGERVHITGKISGLAKNAEHGFHIHEKGDCSSPDGKSAGDHFATAGHPHGAPDADKAQRHTGDFGNINSNKQGVANLDLWSDLPLLTQGEHFVVGRAFVVHAGRDDLKTQPSGDAGARIGCGVIVASPSQAH